ncbi:VOC family protein [Undibacterium sp. Xuan67W]|uniref:VOC family protein n=1 Tax=Undibacterium sp. Xuan67W TaxID=3413057 RepID=UPI003BEF9A9D
MELNAYLTFNNNCEAAFRFYEQRLGGKIEAFHRFGDSPMADQCPPETAQLIMHVSMYINGRTLMGSDNMPGHPYAGIKGFSLSLNTKDVAEAERLFAALSEQVIKIIMPLEKTFWAQRFGMLIDQFGTPWMVNCE